MKIRLATKFDMPEILDMLRNYRDSGIIPGVHDIQDVDTPIRILTYILAGGGLAYVSQKDKQLTGMILAIKSPYLWDNKKFVMNEIVYWVEKNHRGTTAGYRLLTEYKNACQTLKDNKSRDFYLIGKPDLVIKCDEKGFGIIRSKGDQALFRLTTQQLKKEMQVPDGRPVEDFLPTVRID